MIAGPRPQPLGVLPWPAGMLLLPPDPQSAAAAGQILLGGLPQTWPQQLQFYRLALAGEPAAAAAAVPGEDLLSRYNRAVLLGGPGVWEGLARDADDPELRALVHTARYAIGQVQDPPAAEGLSGEVAAMVRSARASAALERGDTGEAVAQLRAAAQEAMGAGSPILAASLRLTLAELLNDTGDPAGAALTADTAIAALPATADRELRAHLQLARGLARQAAAGQERTALLAVVGDLTEAARVFTETSHPERFALCNEHLALAYLMLPMSDSGDRLRLGVAVAALRAALRVYRPQTHPARWASTQVNLANALQYLPSAHRQDNLDEAVQLYEEVLGHRDPATDPLGYARILSNQGNALGHLGVFDDAQERLQRARDLFAGHGDAEAADTVDAILRGLREAAGSPA